MIAVVQVDTGYRATCQCGWRGPTLRRHRDAKFNATTHYATCVLGQRVLREDGTVAAKRQPRRPNGAESVNLNIRIDPELREAAKAKAAEREETLSAAVVRFLREYAAD